MREIDSMLYMSCYPRSRDLW